MTIEYDEKGKYYTNVISKVAVPSIIQTTKHLVRGRIHIRHGDRFKDELENNELYVAVTEASIYDADGKMIYNAPFLAVQREQIVWAMPLEDNENKESAG